MTKKNNILLILLALIALGSGWLLLEAIPDKHRSAKSNNHNKYSSEDMSRIDLPQPQKNSSTSVEEAIAHRRSARNYTEEPLALEELAQLLWSGQGITDPQAEKRAAPSAGALYPLEIYVVIKDSPQLDPGVYHYLPSQHRLEKIKDAPVSQDLAEAALGQRFIADAPVNLIITGDYSVTAQKYGERAEQYVHLEAGHVAENIFLQAESLGLGMVTVGGFQEEKLKRLLDIPDSQTPFYVIPIGKTK